MKGRRPAKRILVTGGLGTVGAGLIADLRARGHHVASCDLHHQPDEIGFSLRTDVEVPLYARCDVGEFRQIERVVERCGPFDFVYHWPPSSAAGTARTSTRRCGEPTPSAPRT